MDTERFPEGDLGIVVYGSLFHRDDLRHLFSSLEDRTARVKLDGYQRVFDARADRRDTIDNRSAVLNLHQGEDWCNGILVTNLTAAEYGVYARRETTYRFELVNPDAISFYRDDSIDLPDEIIVPCDAPSYNDIRPIPTYVSTCLQGARLWGDEFYAEFLEKTYVASGETLSEYFGIQNQAVEQ